MVEKGKGKVGLPAYTGPLCIAKNPAGEKQSRQTKQKNERVSGEGRVDSNLQALREHQRQRHHPRHGNQAGQSTCSQKQAGEWSYREVGTSVTDNLPGPGSSCVLFG